MSEVCYVVTASVPDLRVAGAYIRWLRSGHVQAVLDAGAASAVILSFRADGTGTRGQVKIVTQYTFHSTADLDRYERDGAPALRAEGLRLFGQSGIIFERRVGEVIARFGPDRMGQPP